MKNLKDQVALVTGAGSPTGIGFASARYLAMDGAHLALVSTTDRILERAAELQKEFGIRARGYIADLTQEEAAHKIVGDIRSEFGRLDICVNNAGMTVVGESEQPHAIIEETSLDVWHFSLDRNLTTCFLVTRAVLPIMRAQKYGRIINISSTSGPVQAFIGHADYHAAKAGMVGFTRATAIEAASDGVTVNAIAPGWIATGSQLDDEASAGRFTAIGRSGKPEEIALAVRFLADLDAAFITGQLIVLDGGNSLPEDRTWRP
jgi:3-oxoacyl-[acyl-carrier protein] reductase